VGGGGGGGVEEVGLELHEGGSVFLRQHAGGGMNLQVLAVHFDDRRAGPGERVHGVGQCCGDPAGDGARSWSSTTPTRKSSSRVWRGGETAKLLTLFHPATGEVRVRGAGTGIRRHLSWVAAGRSGGHGLERGVTLWTVAERAREGRYEGGEASWRNGDTRVKQRTRTSQAEKPTLIFNQASMPAEVFRAEVERTHGLLTLYAQIRTGNRDAIWARADNPNSVVDRALTLELGPGSTHEVLDPADDTSRCSNYCATCIKFMIPDAPSYIVCYLALTS
jgi:hypothetical protein